MKERGLQLWGAQAAGLCSAERSFAGAFTLVELLVSIATIVVLAAIAFGAFSQMKQSAFQAKSSSNLRQLGLATQLYLTEHDNQLFKYKNEELDDSGRKTGGATWWFGYESAQSISSGEGQRELDKTKAPLHPYLNQVGGVEICPGFAYNSAIWKPKYHGASYGYGYNVLLGGGWFGPAPASRVHALSSMSQVLLFATCAQVNTFQAPASKSNPLLEEFYGFDQREKTIHFRFKERALGLFLDLHVETLVMAPGTADASSLAAQVGRFSPVGSYKWLQ